MNRILVIEGGPQLQLLYRSMLEQTGFSVITALNGEDVPKKLEATHIGLIVTDVMMPEMDGYDLVGSLRNARFDMLVLMITAKADFGDKKRGFKLGADDYMTKLVDVSEMILRVEALLRRSKTNYNSILTIGQTKLEPDTYTVVQNQHSFILPQKKFPLLYKLLSYLNKISIRQQLMNDIWGLDTNTEEQTIDVRIKHLKTRFEKTEDFQIITVRGLGCKAVI